MNQTKKQQNKLEQILSDILIHNNPELLVWDYKGKIDKNKLNTKQLDEYSQYLNNINYFFKKIIKYEVYFGEFYSNSKKIKKAEALEYHIQSYLEDMDILRNKLRVFLGVLKNDLKKIAVNKKEIDEVMKKFIENVEKTFNEVKKHRHPHHHRGFRFLNNDLVDSNMCSTLLAKDFPLKDKVNIPVVKKREEESFCKAKADYIKLAKNNNKQIMGLINTIFDKNRDFIHTVLNIRAIESIIDLKS